MFLREKSSEPYKPGSSSQLPEAVHSSRPVAPVNTEEVAPGKNSRQQASHDGPWGAQLAVVLLTRPTLPYTCSSSGLTDCLPEFVPNDLGFHHFCSNHP